MPHIYTVNPRNYRALKHVFVRIAPDNVPETIAHIRETIWEELDVLVGDIRFVERGWIVKTTSGKLARAANREKYLQSRR